MQQMQQPVLPPCLTPLIEAVQQDPDDCAAFKALLDVIPDELLSVVLGMLPGGNGWSL